MNIRGSELPIAKGSLSKGQFSDKVFLRSSEAIEPMLMPASRRRAVAFACSGDVGPDKPPEIESDKHPGSSDIGSQQDCSAERAIGAPLRALPEKRKIGRAS